MADVITPVSDTDPQSAPPDGMAQFLASRGKTDLATAQTATPPAPADPPPADPAPLEPAAPEPPAPVAVSADPSEAVIDPETGEAIAEPTRNDRRIHKLWKREQAALAKAAALQQQLDARNAAPPPQPTQTAERPPSSGTPPTVDPWTAAAQARIRPEPNESEIGTTYPTYEAFVKDCAIWGGELAAEKHALRAEAQTKQVAAQTAYQEQAQAYPDFADRLAASRDLKVGSAILDAVAEHPDLAGHLNYWIMTHHDDVARISALPIGKALLEMGSVIGSVRASVAGTPPAAPKPKPPSRAPSPTPAITHPHAPASTRLEDAGSYSEFSQRREAQLAARGRR